MQLIGMLDSPYVRRVAISLQLLGLRFEHQSVSVFSTFEKFRSINPVVKAPTLVCDDAEALAAQAPAHRSLMPAALAERQQALRVIGLALATCEKSVQIVYERMLRPAEKLHQPWVSRVTSQLLAAYGELEAELQRKPLAVTRDTMGQDGVTVGIAWHFTQAMLPEVVSAADYPALREFSARAEALPEFMAAPHSDKVYKNP
jgi:glutathione S-transferase